MKKTAEILKTLLGFAREQEKAKKNRGGRRREDVKSITEPIRKSSSAALLHDSLRDLGNPSGEGEVHWSGGVRWFRNLIRNSVMTHEKAAPESDMLGPGVGQATKEVFLRGGRVERCAVVPRQEEKYPECTQRQKKEQGFIQQGRTTEGRRLMGKKSPAGPKRTTELSRLRTNFADWRGAPVEIARKENQDIQRVYFYLGGIRRRMWGLEGSLPLGHIPEKPPGIQGMFT